MLENIQLAVKIRTICVFLLIHAGLALGIFALARESFPNGWDLTSTLFLVSILFLYGGFVLALLFVVVPLLPWLKRARQVEHWSERLIRDLPLVIDQLPKVVTAFESLLVVWNESKSKSKTPGQETPKVV